LFANDTNRVLGLSQDGACTYTDPFENIHENSLKGDLSNEITLNLPLFSSVNTFKNLCTVAALLENLHKVFRKPVCEGL
jgi:hypothetical protein